MSETRLIPLRASQVVEKLSKLIEQYGDKPVVIEDADTAWDLSLLEVNGSSVCFWVRGAYGEGVFVKPSVE